ncbi:MAG: peptidoglycan DD-metalloendopeptidase family protein [Oscillospiraceae bacterium]|nr:peptidoglycan DD-metalloendopeptidase family protein [Oscillospiraceae bacterium]
MILSFLSVFTFLTVHATKTADELQQEIDELERKSEEIEAEREALEQKIEANQNKTLTIVEQKAQVDREIELTHQYVENINEQIHSYNLLIAEKQAELDKLKTEQNNLLTAYKKRMRAMQERGNITYFEVMIQAKSFADMLNCRVMIEEIARADQRMMDEIRDMAAEVMTAKDALAVEKLTVELKRAELAEAEAVLAEKRAEADALLIELYSDKQKLIEECEKIITEEASLSEQIALLETERTEILYQEWLASQNQNNGQQNDSTNNDSSNSSPPSTNQSFAFPMAYCTMLTSAYGYRIHPITGNYTFHNGVDLAAGTGTEIYATKSGTVTTAEENYVYGNYVVINHLDGYSSLYGHMTRFTVSEGDYVEQGELIGYVGSTGWSNGPHLHFTIYYNGSSVNPMNYISIP